MTPLIYIAGPYTAKDRWETEQNVRRAEDAAYRVMKLGGWPVVPHSNTRPYFEDACTYEQALAGTMRMMVRSDAALFISGWTDSRGARAEHAEAERLGLPIFGIGHIDSGDLGAWIEAFIRDRANP